ncbi:MAG: sigma-70 family RNA polymerase sigma factor [Actinomycetota bacterium]|nr:sigma-70 family RNA polymerase sigma factor [Actinomycetota bacterium]
MSERPLIRPAPHAAQPSTAREVTAPAPRPDDEAHWLTPLTSTGPAHDHAVRELHGLLLRASRFEVGRRAGALGLAHSAELDDIANQAADDALLAVMSRLERFERRSRFTTWAYKFAIHTAGVAVRRHAWRNRELATDSRESLEQLTSLADDPAEAAQMRELLARIAAAIARLTPHQRDVLLALAVDGVPIDVLADRLSTNRNALYKTLHDARTRLRSLLAHEETT